jgi:thiamine-phosphate pyrophosphorylase
MKQVAGFHILTQDLDSYTHQQQAIDACTAGARWIQLRCKKHDFNTWLDIAREVRRICDEFDAVLIINDSIEIAQMLKAAGVHLGKEDKSIADARKALGNSAIIGYSCNTFADIENAAKEGADYVGLGPYRYTSSREKLNPILGLEGIKHVMRDYYIQQMTLPVIAIGGVKMMDVGALSLSGIHGVAVSSAIHQAADKRAEVKSFLVETEKFKSGTKHVSA